jgi:predicted membrane GTPase involved in stress response
MSPRGRRSGVDAVMKPWSETVTIDISRPAMRQKSGLQMVATHVDYTCIGNHSCRIILATVVSGRVAVQNSSGSEWDQVWIGANIATMVAGAAPYGNLETPRWR